MSSEMSRSLPDRVAGLYYAHGLFCSSHPIAVLSLAISVVLLCWLVNNICNKNILFIHLYMYMKYLSDTILFIYLFICLFFYLAIHW